MMDVANFHDLLTDTGQEAIYAAMELAPQEKDFLRHFQQLSRRFPREIARSALETAILRPSAQSKFPQAGCMYFTRDALQQASSYEVASHRAARYQGFEHIGDLGCSIGGDTLAFAEIAPTFGIDRDPLRLAMAKANMHALGLKASFIRTDLEHSFPCIRSSTSTGLFFDPARRENGKRIFSVEQYHPPLSSVSNWLSDFPNMGVKISPAVKIREIEAYEAEIEFISLRGELKEAVLWFGALKSGVRKACVLPGPHIMSDDGSRNEPEREISEPQRYFYEPDPAVIRAGLVQNLIRKRETELLQPLLDFLSGREKTRLVGKTQAEVRAPTVAFSTDKRRSVEIAEQLAKLGLGVGAGDFYAYRLVESLGYDMDDGVVRASFVHYTSPEEIDRLIAALDEIL